MSNLKKILALVLALVMSFSLVTVSSAAYADADEITAKYDESVEVLSALKVFNGRTATEFDPQGTITRAEVAAIIYRVVTGDVKDKQTSIYSDYNKFDDVASTAWYAGYVNFCANAELIKGVGNNMFAPNAPVTGYQALAMILRAVGYDKEGEFTGPNWQVQTAARAEKLHITDTVDEVTLGTAATREVVAELLLRSILVPQVTWNILGYNDKDSIVNGEFNPSIGEEQFALYCDETTTEVDAWGRPGYYWYAYGKKLCAIEEDYIVRYTTAQTECQVASDIGMSKREVTLPTFVNSGEANGTFTIEATDTINTLGAQGRVTEVYADRIVMIDTFLAKVDDVVTIKTDKAGHITRYAHVKLHVYDKVDDTNPSVVYLTGTSNFSYTEGEYLLLNAYGTKWNNLTIAVEADELEKDLNTFVYVENIHTPETVTGAQTYIWQKIAKHTVGTETYDDANTYFLDAADMTTYVNFLWLFDDFGNLIGSDVIPNTYTYAILKDIIWNVGRPGYATATLVDAATGAETKDVVVNSIDGDADYDATVPEDFDWDMPEATPMYSVKTADYLFANDYAYMGDDSLLNGFYNGFALYRVYTYADGSVDLVGYDTDASEAIISYDADTTITTGSSLMVTDANGAVVVNDFTVFTFLGAKNTYKQYVGKANVPTASACEVFYVNVDGDAYVDYVYVKTADYDYSGAAFVMATDDAYYKLYSNSRIYVLKNALVNGVASEDAIKTEDLNLFAKADGTGLINNVEVPHYVTYDADGLLASVDAFTTTLGEIDTDGDGDEDLFYVQTGEVTFCDGTTLVDENDTVYTISDATVVGDYTTTDDVDFEDEDYVNVYVVYTVAKDGDKVVSMIYIIDQEDGTEGGDDYDDGSVEYDVTWTVDGATYTGGKFVIDVTGSADLDAAGTYSIAVYNEADKRVAYKNNIDITAGINHFEFAYDIADSDNESYTIVISFKNATVGSAAKKVDTIKAVVVAN